MVGSISNNSLIAALLGPGAARAPRAVAREHRPDGSIPSTSRAEFRSPVDTVELSPSARTTAAAKSQAQNAARRSTQGNAPTDTQRGDASTPQEEQEVRELEKRDAEVRRHEQAHKAAAGPHASGGATFEFTTGPNGRRYAVSGEVSIDTSEVSGNPRATIAKMQQIRRAALAPANPSSQDRAVAAKAAQIEQKARAQAAQEPRGDATGGTDGPRSGMANPAAPEAASELGDLIDLLG